MALETATYIDALVDSNPAGADQFSTGDDHVRLLKACLQRTFSKIAGAVSASSAELNILQGAAGGGVSSGNVVYLSDVTSNIQAQIDDKAASAHDHAMAIRSLSSSLELTAGDGWGAIHNVVAVVLAIPADTSLSFSTGTEIELVREASDDFSVSGNTGVTLNVLGGVAGISAQYGMARLRKTAANTWLMFGDVG